MANDEPPETSLLDQENTSILEVQSWGCRLSDSLRAAVVRGDWSDACRLARQGDGQTRDLALEYALMVRGLGFTLEVLLGLLVRFALSPDAGARSLAGPIHTQSDRPASQQAASAELIQLLHRLHDAVAADGTDRVPAPDRAESIDAWAETCRHALRHSQARFSVDQRRRAHDVLEALAANDTSLALALLDAKDQAYLALHDPMVRFMADSFAWVLQHRGAQALLAFHLATAEGQRAGFERWEQMSAAEFAAATAFLLKQHMGQVRVVEEAERFTIHQSPCGSGGRLQLSGAYAVAEGEPSLPPLPFVNGPSALTFGEACMPVYCTHCAVWNGTATLRWFGRAQWVFERPARSDGRCTLHIYKRPEDAPADYTRRVAHPASEDGA